MVRNRKTATLLAGTLVVLLSVSVLAVITDVVTFEDNQMESTDVLPPASVEAAQAIEGSCSHGSLVWSRDVLPGISGVLPLQPVVDAGGAWFSTEAALELCVRNPGSTGVGLALGAWGVDDDEVGGVCTPTEAAAGDLDCFNAPGGYTGELSDVLGFQIASAFDNDPSCPVWPSAVMRIQPPGLTSTIDLTGTLAPGAVCGYTLFPGHQPLVSQTVDDVLRAETDVVTFDLAVAATSTP